MNMYLYGYGPRDAERFIPVDVGVTFPTMEATPGVDLIMADPAHIRARSDRLEGIFITHAHEDHVGAWPALAAAEGAGLCPPLHRRDRPAEDGAGWQDSGQFAALPWPHYAVTAGPFTVGFVPVSHSIPESSSPVDRHARRPHPAQRGFQDRPDPVVGDPFDPEYFRAIGDAGVKVPTCDPTQHLRSIPGVRRPR